MLLKPAKINGARLDLHMTRRFNSPVVSSSSHRLCGSLPVNATTPAIRRVTHMHRCVINALSLASCCDTDDFRRSIVSLLERLRRARPAIIVANNDVVCVSTIAGKVSSVPAIAPRVQATVCGRFRRRNLSPVLTRLGRASPVRCGRMSQGGCGHMVRTIRVYHVANGPCSSFHAGAQGRQPFHVVRVKLAHSHRRLCSHVGHHMSRVVTSNVLRRTHHICPFHGLGSLGAINCGRLFGCLSNR